MTMGVWLVLAPAFGAGGLAWVPWGEAPRPRGLHALAVRGARWLVSSGRRLFQSADRGRSWIRVGRLPGLGRRWRRSRTAGRPAEKQPPWPRGLSAPLASSVRALEDRRFREAESSPPPADEALTAPVGGPGPLCALALASELACAGGESGLWCTDKDGSWARRFYGPVGVRALAAAPGPQARIFAATDRGLWVVGPGLAAVDLLAPGRFETVVSAGARVLAIGDGSLWRHEQGRLERVIGLPAGRARALSIGHAGVYLATSAALWRLEGGRWVSVRAAPGSQLTEISACGRRLLVAGPRGAWVLTPLGFRSVPGGGPVRALHCVDDRLVAVTAAGLFVATPSAQQAHLIGIGSGRRLPRPAASAAWSKALLNLRRAGWLPVVTLVARWDHATDARTPRGAVLWPSPRGPLPGWLGADITRIRRADRFEVAVLLRWPIDLLRGARVGREALRAQRHLDRLARRRLRRLERLRRARLRFRPPHKRQTLRKVALRRIRAAEAEALWAAAIQTAGGGA